MTNLERIQANNDELDECIEKANNLPDSIPRVCYARRQSLNDTKATFSHDLGLIPTRYILVPEETDGYGSTFQHPTSGVKFVYATGTSSSSFFMTLNSTQHLFRTNSVYDFSINGERVTATENSFTIDLAPWTGISIGYVLILLAEGE